MPAKKIPKHATATRSLLKKFCQALDDKKAEDIVVLDVSEQSSITNFLVLATGNSEPHLRALRGELDHVIKETKTAVVGVDASAGSGWSVIDAFDVMVHVLTEENRARYRLETLWGDAKPLMLKTLLAKPAAPRKRAKAKSEVSRS